jgi:hypothetical protein
VGWRLRRKATREWGWRLRRKGAGSREAAAEEQTLEPNTDFQMLPKVVR